MSDYYKFWSHFKAYKCQCPDLKDGDECNECMSNSKTHTYITESKTCKKCKCSDLSLSHVIHTARCGSGGGGGDFTDGGQSHDKTRHLSSMTGTSDWPPRTALTNAHSFA